VNNELIQNKPKKDKIKGRFPRAGLIGLLMALSVN
jgi:hypothetical protein